MKEDKFLQIIRSIVGDEYIGDDCAYLKDLGIVISQDSLVENVHFSMEYFTPYQLGYKSAVVNISDILASGGVPKYVTVALSLPKNITEKFISEFYSGLNYALKKYGDIKVIGGDLTASDKIMVSVAIIGTTNSRKISSRSNAQVGQVVVVSGEHGSSGGGLKLLQQRIFRSKSLVEAHLEPKLDYEKIIKIGGIIKSDYAMMDTSDGLADALYKIASKSNKTLRIDFEKVPYNSELRQTFPDEYKELILYGGEDYKIVATLPEELAKELNLTIIGTVEPYQTPVIIENYNGDTRYIVSTVGCFEHWGG